MVLRVDAPAEENEWYFGQIYPLAMFIAPIFVFLDNMGGAADHHGLIPAHNDPHGPTTPLETPSDEYFGWLDTTRPEVSPQRRRLLYTEKLSLSSISVLGPLTPMLDEEHLPAMTEVWGSRPSRHEPFLGYYNSLFRFSYLIFYLCTWIIFTTFIIIFADFAFYDVPDITIPTFSETDPFLGNIGLIILDDQSPFYNTITMLFWIFVIHPTSSVISIMCWPGRGLHESPIGNVWGLSLCIISSLCPLVLPIATYLSCTLVQGICVFAIMVLAYIVLCFLSVMFSVGRVEVEGWKRLSDEVEMTSTTEA